jgi:hypothetical protein
MGSPVYAIDEVIATRELAGGLTIRMNDAAQNILQSRFARITIHLHIPEAMEGEPRLPGLQPFPFEDINIRGESPLVAGHVQGPVGLEVLGIPQRQLRAPWPLH